LYFHIIVYLVYVLFYCTNPAFGCYISINFFFFFFFFFFF